jgi:hypothetical protein
MQAMTQMMERLNFVMGNVCGRFDNRVERSGNEASTRTEDIRILRRTLVILVMVVLRMRS